MNSVRLYYMIHKGKSDLAKVGNKQMDQWLSELSMSKRKTVQRLINSDDQIASLLASQLLKMCARDEAVDDFLLCDVNYPETGKPNWQSKQGYVLDFNISHSNQCVLVAASNTVKIGVDVEKIRELKNLSFKMVMLPDELKLIRETPTLFFELWSKKEAVVKAANTSGLSRMRDVILMEDQATLDGVDWYLNSVETGMQLDDQYEIYLATSEPVDKLIIKNIILEDLIKDPAYD